MHARAFARADLVASVVASTALLAAAAVALGPPDRAGHGVRTLSMVTEDGTRLGQIHQALVIAAAQSNGRMPTPGLIDRLPVDMGGQAQDIPGRGEEDVTQNTTAHLHSTMIMQNYYAPDLVVSRLERNPKVTVDDDYDHTTYDVMNDQYWDDAFVADLVKGSNVSYASMPLTGDRVKMEWRDSMNAAFAPLGSRGPLDGAPDARSFTSSPYGAWSGSLCFNDNHVEVVATFAPRTIRVDGQEIPDNLFRADDEPRGRDVLLAFTTAMTAKGATLQFD